MKSSFELFTHDSDRKDRYRHAIRLLQEAGIHTVLLELSTSNPLPKTDPNVMQAAAAEHFETLGYQKCLSDLFNLEELGQTATQKVHADFGAIDTMLAAGDITPEQAEILREG